MSIYEFKVVPAPIRPRKLTGLARDQDRFCATLTDVMTDLGLEGWEFLRSETLPFESRRFGLFWRRAERSCLVFRRKIPSLVEARAEEAVRPRRVARPETAAPISRGPGRLTLSEPLLAPSGGGDRPSAPQVLGAPLRAA